MGSDLSMNPPRPDLFQVYRDGHNLILMRQRDPIYGDEPGWQEVWVGPDDESTVALLKAQGHDVPKRKVDVTGTVDILVVRVVKVECQVVGCRFNTPAESGPPGDIDARATTAATCHAQDHGPNVQVRRVDKSVYANEATR